MVGPTPFQAGILLSVLLTWIAEVAEEPLALEPGNRRVEWETNTWSLGAGDEDGRPLSAAEVVAAFEQTAAGIRERIRELGFSGVATFYVWHDGQAGQLRCSTGSVPPEELPFDGTYRVADQLGPIVEGFLADNMPGVVAWPELDEADGHLEQVMTEPEIAPLRVWTSSVGTSH
ncbi:hypothetical protein VSR01_37455 [Actinacidiphila sp. DG2A-62]|uniref:hypothetical protein n=1 Tax=Actinacidiphila sp. DG2A-62 TaxID=3108821 RepID=UPI002DB591A4|nr:hypothetical protein [Actinacidiphila sp. DG2A-62]MEC3998870.1 hypothetical protein [Actinacidiphila sp. DG2A-62]